MTRPSPAADPGADVIAWAHNETSTGVMVAVERPRGCRRRAGPDRRDLGRRRPAGRPRQSRTPTTSRRRRRFGSDGGLWLALLSPAAIARIEELDGADGRWQPAFLSLRDRARQLAQGPDLQHAGGGDAAPARRPDRLDARARAGSTGACSAAARPSAHLYGWAEATRVRDARSSADPGQALAGRRNDRLRRLDRRRGARRRPCARTASSTSSPTASSAATSCGSGCSRRSSPPTSRR